MPRKHREPKKRNTEKINRRRELRKEAEAAAFAADAPKAEQAALVVSREFPGCTVEFAEELNRYCVFDGKGIMAAAYTDAEITRKYKRYAGKFLSRYELILEITDELERMGTNSLLHILDQFDGNRFKEISVDASADL